MARYGYRHFVNGIERVYYAKLIYYSSPGKPCDNCKLPMALHVWFDMNQNCDIVNCSLKDKEYVYKG